VQLDTPRPLDFDGVKVSGSAQGNYSETTEEFDPRGALMVSRNFGDRFGILASLAYADTTFRSDAVEGGSWRPFSGPNTLAPAGTAAQRVALNANGTRYYYFRDDRESLGGTLTLQFRPSDQLEFTVDALGGRLQSERNTTRDDAPAEGGVPAPLTSTIVDGVMTSASFTNIQQRVGAAYYTTDEDLRQIVARADWTPSDNWRISPFIGYSERESDRTNDLYSFRLAANGVFDPGVVTYQTRGDFVDFSSTATDFMSNPQNFLFNVFIFRPSNDLDQEFTTKLDAERYFDDLGGLKSVQFGLRYVDRQKTRVATQTRLNRAAGVGTTVIPNLSSVSQLFTDFHVAGSGPNTPTALLSVDPSRIRQVYFPNGTPVTGSTVLALTGFDAQQSYQIAEETLNAYVEGQFEFGQTDLNVGLRLVNTDQTASGSTVENINLPTQRISPVSRGNSYTEYLPSASLRHEFNEQLVLRAAYSKTLTRPDLDQLAPSETVRGIDAGGGTGTQGNPELQPFTADNLDLGLEWYFAPEGLIAGTFFYKDIDGLIDVSTFTESRTFPRQADGVLVTAPILFTRPINGVSAEIQGFEFTAQSRFDFLPEGPLQNLGGIFNYTYAKSSADFSVANDVRSTGLPGLSRNSFNAIVYYDDGRIDARLSYAWRENYLAQFSDDFGVPRFVDDYGQLDFSASYHVNDAVSVQMQAINLTDEQLINQSSSRYLPYGVSELDRRVLFGVRFSY
jgi:TonB-dependent receptor